jgi:transposase
MAKNGIDSKTEALMREGMFNHHYQEVKDALFLEKDFFDPRDIVQVKYEMLRRVRAEGQTVTQAAAAFGFSRLSFYQAQSAFDEGGLPGIIPRKRGPRGAHKLTDEVMEFIERAVSDDKSLRLRDLVGLVEERFGVVVHPRTIERRLASVQKKRR